MTGSPEGRDTLTALVITADEERNIRDCLSTLSFADEIVVVDSGSADKTARIAAEEFGARVFVNPWPGYGAQKNFGMDRATGDWILVVDADERVTPELRMEISAVLSGAGVGGPEAFQVPRKNFQYGRWIAHGGAYPDWQLRLFRKGKARYNDVEVHENMIVEGAVGYLRSPFLHYTERDTSERIAKLDRYTTLSARERRKRWRGRTGWSHLLLHPAATFFKFYVLKRGYRDGVPGFVYGASGAFYTFLKYAKLEEGSGREGGGAG